MLKGWYCGVLESALTCLTFSWTGISNQDFFNNNESTISINKPRPEGICQFANSNSTRKQKQVSGKVLPDSYQLWQHTVLYLSVLVELILSLLLWGEIVGCRVARGIFGTWGEGGNCFMRGCTDFSTSEMGETLRSHRTSGLLTKFQSTNENSRSYDAETKESGY